VSGSVPGTRLLGFYIMGTLQKSEMRDEVESIIDRTDKSSAVNTRLQWAVDEIAGKFPWQVTRTEDTSLTLVDGTKSYAIPTTLRTVESLRWSESTAAVGAYLGFKETDQFYDDYPYAEGQAESRPYYYTIFGGNVILHPIPNVSANITATAAIASSGTFIVGEVIDQTGSGAAGTVASVTSTTVVVITVTSGTFNATGLLTGAGGATMTPTSVANVETYTLHFIGQKWAATLTNDTTTSSLDRSLDPAIVYLAASMMFEFLQEEDTANYWANKSEALINEAWGAEQAFTPEIY